MKVLLAGLTLVWFSAMIASVACLHGGRSERFTSIGNMCSKYSSIMPCTKNPCCKTGPSVPDSSCCDYCTKGNGFCMSHSMMWQNCERDYIIVHGQCPPKNSTASKSHLQSAIVSTSDYYLNLTMTDIVKNTSPGTRAAISFSSNVDTQDAVMSDCCGTCEAPILMCVQSDTDSFCRPIGNASVISGSFINETDPAKGVVLRFGKTNCCLQGPGEDRTQELTVELDIVPDLTIPESNEMDLEWLINQLSDVSVLENCSMATDGKFRGEIVLQDYFRRLVYKLSPSKSSLSCRESWKIGNSIVTVTCQIFPVWASNSSLASSFVCSRLQLSFCYSDGSCNTLHMSQVNNHQSDQCKLTVSRNNSLMTLGILDSDDTPLGVPYNVSASKVAGHESFGTPLDIGLVTGIGFLLVCCLAAVVFYRCNRGTRSEDNVHRDSSPQPNSNDSGTAQGNEESAEESAEGFACDHEDTERTALLSNPSDRRAAPGRQGSGIELLDSVLEGMEEIKCEIVKRLPNTEHQIGNSRGNDNNKNNNNSN